MKAQRVKNAVIVPTGAKGGFYPKQLPNPALDRDAWAAEGKESYKLFIRTLLSVTDNIVDGKVVHPAAWWCTMARIPISWSPPTRARRPSPTPPMPSRWNTASGWATPSPAAARTAMTTRPWASPRAGHGCRSSATSSKWAWTCRSDPVRVAGCGDMSGDVFGNGMLLSKAIRLVAAFDHRHIFIDPDPDPAASWKESKRLFRLPRSSWADYSGKLMSKGGGIYPAQPEAHPPVPAGAQGAGHCGCRTRSRKPDLRHPEEPGGPLLVRRHRHLCEGREREPCAGWRSGKRCPARQRREVQARVIGEGANLGVTQAGRIEFALYGAHGAGGRINTDFIDNSAGVDCSDNEVNIKIALSAAKSLPAGRRNALLAEMTGEVAALVLEDNRLQALTLSIAQSSALANMGAAIRLVEALEEAGHLDRRTEGLAAADVLARRAAEGQGLTRPELAVLLSSAKLALQDALEHSALALDPAADALVLSDFPPQMQQEFRDELLGHRLRREIVATVTANRVVNRLGLIHPFELAEEEGVSLAEIGCAFTSAADLLGMEALWDAIDRAAMPEQARLLLFDQAALALRGHMADFLRSGGCKAGPSGLGKALAPIVADLAANAERLLGHEVRAQADAIEARLVQVGAPRRLAEAVARLFAEDGAIGLATLARDTRIPPVDLASAFIGLGTMLGLDWAQGRATLMSPADPWERLLVAGLARDMQQMRLDFLRGLATDKSASIEARVDAWAGARPEAIARLRSTLARAQASAAVTPAMLAQFAGQARHLLQH
jgi:glutamate dehydrogenase